MKLDAIPFNVRYKLSNEYAMSSTVTVKYDNGQFYWEIQVNSRQDSVQPSATLAGNNMTEQFNLAWNQRRVFTWDGQEYTAYSASGNQAMVDAAGKLPHVITGPLTAGLIPWGFGRFSVEALAAAQIAAQRNADGTIDMTIVRDDGSSAHLTLNPAQGYAVTKATRTSAGGATVTYTCSGYRQVAGNWVPSSVTIERQSSSFNDRLPTSEQWTFTSVSATAPTPDAFRVSLAPNALVEYSSPVATASAVYIQSNTMDTRSLLVQRLAYAAGRGLAAPELRHRRRAGSRLGVRQVHFGGCFGRSRGAGRPDEHVRHEAAGREPGPLLPGRQSAIWRPCGPSRASRPSCTFPGKNHFVVLSEMDAPQRLARRFVE